MKASPIPPIVMYFTHLLFERVVFDFIAKMDLFEFKFIERLKSNEKISLQIEISVWFSNLPLYINSVQPISSF